MRTYSENVQWEFVSPKSQVAKMGDKLSDTSGRVILHTKSRRFICFMCNIGDLPTYLTF